MNPGSHDVSEIKALMAVIWKPKQRGEELRREGMDAASFPAR